MHALLCLRVSGLGEAGPSFSVWCRDPVRTQHAWKRFFKAELSVDMWYLSVR